MGRRAQPNRKRRASGLILRREALAEALRLAERLDPPLDAPPSPIALTRAERVFLAELLRRAVDASLQARPRRRWGKNAGRDQWVAIDFHTRTGRHRAKHVADDWAAFKLRPRQVATIATRWRAACRRLLRVMNADALRAILPMNKARLLQIGRTH